MFRPRPVLPRSIPGKKTLKRIPIKTKAALADRAVVEGVKAPPEIASPVIDVNELSEETIRHALIFEEISNSAKIPLPKRTDESDRAFKYRQKFLSDVLVNKPPPKYTIARPFKQVPKPPVQVPLSVEARRRNTKLSLLAAEIADFSDEDYAKLCEILDGTLNGTQPATPPYIHFPLPRDLFELGSGPDVGFGRLSTFLEDAAAVWEDEETPPSDTSLGNPTKPA